MGDKVLDPVTADVMNRWESVLDGLEQESDELFDRTRLGCETALAGVLPRARRTRLVGRNSCPDRSADLRPEKGLYHRLVAGGRMKRLSTDAEVLAAVDDPAHRHPCVFPGTVPAGLSRPGGGRFLGLR